MATPQKPGFADKQKNQPLPATGGRIDARDPDKDLDSEQPSGGMHDTNPMPGNEAPGQVTKM